MGTSYLLIQTEFRHQTTVQSVYVCEMEKYSCLLDQSFKNIADRKVKKGRILFFIMIIIIFIF